MSAPSPRRIAYDVLRAVQVDDAYANLLLPVRIRRAALSRRDAGFATELAYGAIRMLGRWDRIIAAASGRKSELIEADVLDVLRIGTHQLLAMRVPTHAAVSESVDLAREVGLRRAAGFVNAVLRKVAARSDAEWDSVILTGLYGSERLAARWSHPVWVVDALRASLRAADADEELEALLAADDAPPALQLVALPGRADPSSLRNDVSSDTFDDAVSPVGVRGASGDPARIGAVSAGAARVQDEGSQLAALALTRTVPVRAGERWLDMCAGPGGKAALLAAEAQLGGAVLVANELVPARAGLVRQALDGFPQVDVVEGDARRFGTGEADRGAFDRILLDAPCTGLGALRRRPEARWRKTPDDVPELVALQRSLLDAAVHALAPGGLLAYVTCSPLLAETRDQVAGLLARHGTVLEQLDVTTALRSIALRDPQSGPGPAAQLWPHRIGTDAMFVALFRRVGTAGVPTAFGSAAGADSVDA
ncbi:RsmB/NOP family class I SAM-dependent RNA methyltransferase [Curtobacterium ammoniigenes]|uniref:RsmB/NOP family class I SAM-dependent RNA methyltransferase n=1 Tax=Curtobacterium ammoniigenes TaxID=395387 RepID=UPI0009FABAB7|nr:transcription antitermination factor NusB [Curtobacterium ammoniigenes]